MSNKLTSVHSKIRTARILRDITIPELSRLTGISERNIVYLEKGKTTPRKETARKLYRFFDGEVSLGDIYDSNFDSDELERLKQLSKPKEDQKPCD